MRIEDRGAAEAAARESKAQAAARTQAAEGLTSGRTATPSVRAEGDQLQLSTLAGRIRSAFETMARDHTARMKQVAAEVQAGSYKVDEKKLSRAMLAEVGLP